MLLASWNNGHRPASRPASHTPAVRPTDHLAESQSLPGLPFHLPSRINTLAGRGNRQTEAQARCTDGMMLENDYAAFM